MASLNANPLPSLGEKKFGEKAEGGDAVFPPSKTVEERKTGRNTEIVQG